MTGNARPEEWKPSARDAHGTQTQATVALDGTLNVAFEDGSSFAPHPHPDHRVVASGRRDSGLNRRVCSRRRRACDLQFLAHDDA